MFAAAVEVGVPIVCVAVREPINGAATYPTRVRNIEGILKPFIMKPSHTVVPHGVARAGRRVRRSSVLVYIEADVAVRTAP